jgi:hypothetical protein
VSEGKKRIDYVKPTILDLGAVTSLVGQSCSNGGTVAACGPGGTPGVLCDVGGLAQTCGKGSGATIPT